MNDKNAFKRILHNVTRKHQHDTRKRQLAISYQILNKKKDKKPLNERLLSLIPYLKENNMSEWKNPSRERMNEVLHWRDEV